MSLNIMHRYASMQWLRWKKVVPDRSGVWINCEEVAQNERLGLVDSLFEMQCGSAKFCYEKFAARRRLGLGRDA